MPGDCAWLEHLDWVADELVRRHEVARAEYYARQEREQAASKEHELRAQSQRRHEAGEAVRFAVDVLGVEGVLELVGELTPENSA